MVSNRRSFGVTRRSEDDAVVLAVSGAVDEVTAPSLATHLDVVLMAEPSLLVIDLTAVEFMSSAGMNLLIETQRLTASSATNVRVAADGSATSRPMRFIGIDRIIELYSTVYEALHGRQSSADFREVSG
jgi:anti-sigma B factor antagonist